MIFAKLLVKLLSQNNTFEKEDKRKIETRLS